MQIPSSPPCHRHRIICRPFAVLFWFLCWCWLFLVVATTAPCCTAFHQPTTTPIIITPRDVQPTQKIYNKVPPTTNNIPLFFIGLPHKTSDTTALLFSRRHPSGWDGDDLRWSQRMRRRYQRARAIGGRGVGPTPIRDSLIVLNILAYFYQVISTVNYARKRYPSHWPQHATNIILDTLFGLISSSPFASKYAFSSILAKRQPYRYITGGFLHGNLFHILFNMNSLRKHPSWIETGLGSGLYLTTYLTSIVTGHLFHATMSPSSIWCLGASGGICGLYGLMFVSLVRMGSRQAAGATAKGLGVLLLVGWLFDSISNAAHIGGILGGMAVGILCGPSYTSSYAMRRKNSVAYDPAPREYRRVMGFGIAPSNRGLIPLRLFWILAFIGICSLPQTQKIPDLILRAIGQPSSF